MLNRSVTLTETQRFLLRNVSIIVLGLFINQMLQTVGSIVLARVLDDPTKFGQVNLLLQIFGMASLFLNVGFNSSLIYTFSRKPLQAVQTNFRVAFFGSSLFGIIFGLILALLAPFLANYYQLPELKGALTLSAIMFMFNSMINIGVASFSGNRDFAVQAFFMVITTTLSTSGMVLGVIWPLGQLNLLENISIWMSVGAILTALFIGWKVERVHNPKWLGNIPLQEVRIMMAYGIPSWAGNIAKAFQQPFLVMMVGSSSVVAVGYLSNGFRITGFIGIITWAFMIVTFPFVAESAQDQKESQHRGTSCVRYNNIFLYPMTAVICLYPDQINGFLFGESFNTGDSAIYIRLMALGVLFSSVGRLGGSILAGIGKTKANFWVMIVAGVFVVAIVPFIAAESPVLAVWIYTGGWAVSAIAMIGFFYYEKFPLNWWKAYGEPLLPTLGMIAIMQIGALAPGWYPLFIVGGLLCLLALSIVIEKRAATDMHKLDARQL
ncbi:oligosaccharide flippase family protein [Paenibacillus qinlingensis]|uniref:O-antigen/teichoic acid export membrane protein n=1 Tax=Paenibacillus qinlingensis TaxID=1837343 RepID=A0ABU1P680_9BACL|nr:oligosaccharide flippase family protein [Paenibacillus qinlingensis]MDR6555268.1 O-antigen/teichoic acid export membrane protein [Paenibacillus qinlingensis]